MWSLTHISPALILSTAAWTCALISGTLATMSAGPLSANSVSVSYSQQSPIASSSRPYSRVPASSEPSVSDLMASNTATSTIFIMEQMTFPGAM